MTKSIILFMGITAVVLTSCGDESKGEKGAWSQEFKDEIHKNCMDGAKESVESDGDTFDDETKKRSSTICDCVVDKLEEKYDPNEDIPDEDISDITIDCAADLLQEEIDNDPIGETAAPGDPGNWTDAHKEEFKADCVATESGNGDAIAMLEELCDCVVGKMAETDYATMGSYEEMADEDKMTQCAEELGIGN